MGSKCSFCCPGAGPKILVENAGETRKKHHGRKEEWQLEECQEQIAHEYDKLYGRKGTQPLLAAPWQRVEVKDSRMTNHSEQAHYKVKILYHAGQLLQMLLC